MSVRARRVCAWLVGAACLVAIIVLGLTAVLDLATGVQTASVASGVVALIGLATSVITLLATSGTASDRRRTSSLSVRSRGRGAVAAGGDVRGNVVGRGARMSSPPHTAGPPATAGPAVTERNVSARGTGALGAAGDIVDNAIGEDSER